MKRIIELEKYHFLYNAEAFFAASELYEDTGVMEELSMKGKRGYDALCRLLAICSEQGELMRRYQGYTPMKPLTYEELKAGLDVRDVGKARTLLMTAIIKGCNQDPEGEEKEVDLVLEEIEKKTGNE